MVPEMAHAGEGYKFHVTGLTHDERGYPNMTPPMQKTLVGRLQNKILSNIDRITMVEEDSTENCDVIVVSYGITSRVAQRAIDMARAQGLKVGKLRLITAWPFPDVKIHELAAAPRPSSYLNSTLAKCRAKCSAPPKEKPRRTSYPTPEAACMSRRHSRRDPGGCPMTTLVNPVPADHTPGNPVEPFLRMRPHAAHLVPGMRHRDDRQLLCRGADRIQNRS